jgi:hypothetical protein
MDQGSGRAQFGAGAPGQARMGMHPCPGRGPRSSIRSFPGTAVSGCHGRGRVHGHVEDARTRLRAEAEAAGPPSLLLECFFSFVRGRIAAEAGFTDLAVCPLPLPPRSDPPPEQTRGEGHDERWLPVNVPVNVCVRLPHTTCPCPLPMTT